MAVESRRVHSSDNREVLTPSSPHDSRFRFQPVSEGNLRMLAEWLTRAHVAEYWGEPSSVEELRADYLAPEREDPSTEAFIVSFDGRPIGFIQVYTVAGCSGGWWPDETDPGARGIDQFLAEADDLNKGMGSAMIRAFLTRLFASADVTTDPDRSGSEKRARHSRLREGGLRSRGACRHA